MCLAVIIDIFEDFERQTSYFLDSRLGGETESIPREKAQVEKRNWRQS
jgi:hypothetical protein